MAHERQYSLYAVAESLSACSELMNMVRAEYGTWKHWRSKFREMSEMRYVQHPQQKLVHIMMDAHRLKGLEGAVEEEVPNNFPIFKGGNVEDEEVAKHSQRG